MPDFLPQLLTVGNVMALAVFFACLFGSTWLIEHSSDERPSTSRLMAFYRRRWMHEVPYRSNRVLDSTLLVTLRNGSAFFASGSMIAIGGIAALLGQTERLVDVAEDLTGSMGTDRADWEAKLIFILLLMVWAFLSFVWSHRLFGYCAILMGAIPEHGSQDDITDSASRAAKLNISAGRSFNRGLRLVYFAIAALAWFMGPVALIVATLMTVATIYRREFRSLSREALLKGWTPGGGAPT